MGVAVVVVGEERKGEGDKLFNLFRLQRAQKGKAHNSISRR